MLQKFERNILIFYFTSIVIFIGIFLCEEIFSEIFLGKIWSALCIIAFSALLYLRELKKVNSEIYSSRGGRWVVIWSVNILIFIVGLINSPIASGLYNKIIYQDDRFVYFHENMVDANNLTTVEIVSPGEGILPFLKFKDDEVWRGAYLENYHKGAVNSSDNGHGKWDSLFSWLIAIMTIVISFVVSWVYLIAREAKEQAGLVSGALGLDDKMRKIKSAMLVFDLKSKISLLLHDFDGNERSAEKILLKKISQYTVEAEEVLKNFSDLENAKGRLSMAVKFFNRFKTEPARMQLIRDDLATIFNIQFVVYLEDLLHRLHAHPIANQAKGRACIEEVEKLWRLLR